MRRASIGVVALLAACSSPELFRERRVSRQDEAGSVHFALLSVAPWRDYVDALQPTFELSEEQALAEVIPATRLLQESIVDVVQASAGVATPQRARLRTELQTDSGTEITTEEKEELPAFPPSAGVPGNPIRREAGDPRTNTLGEAALDPMTRYWAATALYQEVQLLNRYVRDAAVRPGFEAYVVRLQVSLMPSARGEPYDAYCNLGFFEGSEGGAPSSSLRDPDLLAGTASRAAPQVIPLMVTDNLEAGMQSRALDTVRQVAGAIYAMSFSAGVSADVQAMQENLQSVFGQDLNSLLTVGRVTDNTIRVRLGAQQQASADFAMVPRSHNVTLLLLVPEGSASAIDVIMRSTMVDVATGQALPPRTELEIASLLTEVGRAHGIDGRDPGFLQALLEAAQRNDRAEFETLLAALLGDEKVARRRAPELWLDLVATMAGSRYAATQFDLPRPGPRVRGDAPDLPPAQTALLEDDGVACSTTMRSGGLPGRAQVVATLLVPVDGRDLPIHAERCEIDEIEGVLRLRFPSLVGWGLATREEVKRLRLELDVEGLRFELDALHRFAPAAEERSATASEGR